MKHFGSIKIAACATLLFAAVPLTTMWADNWDRKTTISFSDAVQVPGATLPAGKYIFKLMDSPSDRYIVQIFNERQDHIFATVLAIANDRMTAPDKTQIRFYEAPAGQPQPIKAWFYPGDTNGREFLYSKAEADVISRAAHEPVPTEETATLAQNPAPVAAAPAVAPAVASDTEQSTEQSVEEDGIAATPAPIPVAAEPEPKQESPMVDDDQDQPQDPPAPAATSTDTTTMPSTGSELPLAGLIGLSSIAAAASLRAFRRLS